GSVRHGRRPGNDRGRRHGAARRRRGREGAGPRPGPARAGGDAVTRTVALAYSGGLDTSVAARWLAEERGLRVVAVTVDVGQEVDREELVARAGAAGAELVVVDAREEFARDFCWPALAANALYEGKYPLVSSLARPLIAAKVI